MMITSNSAAMLALYETAKKAADSSCTVLVTGETGTGKELLARDIHDKSPRADGPFVAVNCGALAESLLESELFGHEKGSFTGATSQRRGVFEQADGGTIFLDEIGETSLALQAKLLRVLEDGEIRRVGGRKTIKVDVRILSATNANIDDMMAKNKFREDLFYRINTMRLHLPPLRERTEDISMLASYFHGLFNKDGKYAGKTISKDAMEFLAGYSWPGNIRQLYNVVEVMTVLSSGEEIGVADIPAQIKQQSTKAKQKEKLLLHLPEEGMPLKLALNQYRHALIVQAIERTKGNKSAAAKLLGISRVVIHRHVKNRRKDTYEN